MEDKYYVYILRSLKNGKLYTGFTKDLQKRVLEHNTNKNKKQFTALNGPWELAGYEIFNEKSAALKHERFLKTGKGREYVKKFLYKK